MTWQREWDAATERTTSWRRKGPVTRFLEKEPDPYDCPTATFDGGDEDPRMRVYYYQQTMRAALLAKVADEAGGPVVWRHALAACREGLRRLRLAEPSAGDSPAPASPTAQAVREASAGTAPASRLLTGPA